MLDHVTLHVSDLPRSKEFYASALKPLGYLVSMDMPQYNVAGLASNGKSDFWLNGDGSKQTMHIAFHAEDKDTVDGFFDAAMDAGARDNGKPGYRKDYAPGYYGAFVLDPDGHNIEVVFHDPAPAE
jgi:catechol 2,3-dioxygenase-like lactoylglutathione lyase family enzyme